MNTKTLRRAGLLWLLASSIPATALAEGGAGIAGAPVAPYGQQQFGNLANGGVEKQSCDNPIYRVWWLLPVLAGDQVTIDWEVASSDYTYPGLNVFPIGTTDYTYSDAEPVVRSSLAANGKAEATLTATQSGSLPMDVISQRYDCLQSKPGPYDFTAYVKHAVRLGVPKTAKLGRSGVLNVAVHTPDGNAVNDQALAVTLQAKKRTKTKYRAIGIATATNGTAAVSYTVPPSLRRQKINLRAIAAGANYVSQTSSVQKSKVR